ncbi:hypothetical protein Q5752_004917 [Cryptotrichosporon argae]
MSVDTPMQRAHALAAQASQLLSAKDPPLARAMSAFKEAAELFEASTSGVTDDATRAALRTLIAQNRKAARDVERRIAHGLRSPSSSPSSSSPPLSRDPSVPFSALARPLPFALPVPSSPNTARPDLVSRATEPARLPSAGPSDIFKPSPVSRPSAGHPVAGPSTSPSHPSSPLYSSSSSSDPESSYVIHGLAHDPADPFSRFWATLDGMLEGISNPVRFASVPIGGEAAVDDEKAKAAGDGRIGSDVPDARGRADKVKDRERRRDKGNGNARARSPSDSYYVVPADGRVKDEADDAYAPTNGAPARKTPEELALENDNLRASLDALAVHAQALERRNRELAASAEEREQIVRSVISEVKSKARKAVQDEVARSTVLAQSKHPGAGEDEARLRKHVAELEDEVRRLRGENESQRAQLDKYIERWEKLKAKKEAKRESERERARR